MATVFMVRIIMTKKTKANETESQEAHIQVTLTIKFLFGSQSLALIAVSQAILQRLSTSL